MKCYCTARAVGLSIAAVLASVALCGCDIIDLFPTDGGTRDRQETKIVSLSGKVGATEKDAKLKHGNFTAALPSGTSFDYNFDGQEHDLMKAARKIPFFVYAGCGLLIVIGVGIGFVSKSNFGIMVGGGIAASSILVYAMFYAFNSYPWMSLLIIFGVILGIVGLILYRHDPTKTE